LSARNLLASFFSMARIHALSPALVGQIAAGEVVERPASALKELVENSLDAGATHIHVELGKGGTDIIRIVDNGGGIHPEDIKLALTNHATSKVASADDLARIGTLGFRGEALASLAAVAQVKLQSRPPDQPLGAEVSARGGDISVAVAWSGPPGTRVEVRHLFFRVPARRKFLRSVTTEWGHAQEAFIRLALSRPGVHFTLVHDDRPVYEVPAALGVLDRIGLFFGSDVANSMYALDEVQEGTRVTGSVGDPSCDRSGPSLQYLFVNGRWVRDRGLFQAVQEAYAGLVMSGRYPAAFLFLDLPADSVDVNAHPAKAEVRFRDRGAVYTLVRDAVRSRLAAAELTARAAGARKVNSAGPPRMAAPATGRDQPTLDPDRPVSIPPAAPAGPPPQTFPTGVTTPLAQGDASFPPVGLFPVGAAVSARTSTAARPAARAMQVLGCYLVVEEPPDRVLFLDQHALHERILFGRLHTRLAAGRPECQRLLTPEPVDLPPVQAALLLEHREALAELGLLVEDFGGGTLLLTGYPAALGQQPPVTLLRGVAEYLAEQDRLPDREHLLRDLAALAACHAAVRAGDRLTDVEIAELLVQREVADDAHHCPHGRPTAVVFSRRDLEKLFKRV
jgi:DNA mismatch repair protein MutL